LTVKQTLHLAGWRRAMNLSATNVDYAYRKMPNVSVSGRTARRSPTPWQPDPGSRSCWGFDDLLQFTMPMEPGKP
ncbi:MAG: hypothetical protein QNL05_15025, partial [Gammaproteobacteria bacterium]|nr:hypothetical protein [Gammaproteobacteria bacterium]